MASTVPGESASRLRARPADRHVPPSSRGASCPPGASGALPTRGPRGLPRAAPRPLAAHRPRSLLGGPRSRGGAGSVSGGGLGVCPALLLPARGTGVSSPLPAAAAHSAGRPAAGRVGCPGAMAWESLLLLLLLAALGSRGQSPSPPPPPQRGTGERGARASPARPGPRRGRRPPRHQLGNPCGDGRDEGTGTESDK